MTGREQKVYYSYSQMSNKHSVPDEGPPSMATQDQRGSGFALPELEHNLQLLIDLTEQDILQVWGNQTYLANIFGFMSCGFYKFSMYYSAMPSSFLSYYHLL